MLTIRQATLQDTEKIVTVVNRAYRGESGHQGWTTEAGFIDGQRTDPSLLAETLNRPDSFLLVAIDGSENIVGSVHIEKKSDHEAYLGMLTVDISAQRQGLGDRLMHAAEAFAQSRWGSRKIVMTVIQLRTELIAWYERRGYRDTGETEPFPYGDDRFGRPNRSDLFFRVLVKDCS